VLGRISTQRLRTFKQSVEEDSGTVTVEIPLDKLQPIEQEEGTVPKPLSKPPFLSKNASLVTFKRKREPSLSVVSVPKRKSGWLTKPRAVVVEKSSPALSSFVVPTPTNTQPVPVESKLNRDESSSSFLSYSSEEPVLPIAESYKQQWTINVE